MTLKLWAPESNLKPDSGRRIFYEAASSRAGARRPNVEWGGANERRRREEKVE